MKVATEALRQSSHRRLIFPQLRFGLFGGSSERHATCISLSRERYLYLTLIYLEKFMAAVSLRLPDDVTQRLAHLVELTGRSKTFYMVEAIREHIDDLEDLYLAEQRLIDIRAGKTKTVPLEEVMKRYGLEG